MSQAELQSERHEPLVSGGLAALTSLDQLVKAREAKGLSPSDLAVRLGMVPRQILAIERGDWTALPGRSFARSALRSYGRALGVDLSSLLPAIDSAFGQTQEYVERPALDQPMPRRGVLGFSSSGSGTWLAWTILVAVVLVVLAFFYGGGASLLSPGETASPTRPQGSQGARPSSVAPTPAAGAAPAAPAIAGSSGGASASSASQAPASPVSSVPATSAGSAAVTPAAAPAQPGPAAPGAQPASSGGAATVAPIGGARRTQAACGDRADGGGVDVGVDVGQRVARAQFFGAVLDRDPGW